MAVPSDDAAQNMEITDNVHSEGKHETLNSTPEDAPTPELNSDNETGGSVYRLSSSSGPRRLESAPSVASFNESRRHAPDVAASSRMKWRKALTLTSLLTGAFGSNPFLKTTCVPSSKHAIASHLRTAL